ncbi:NACHT-NTPase sigma domain-containing protein [Madurella fahalii]|uniref:NACHT-NTPase sigma domain-containing protein n=1 Tax=Madurella fahalii TaxID=1157608 RepID=A0ABQ0G610_9PEZI
MEKISGEISVFIKARVKDIGTQLTLTEKEQGALLERLMRVPNRTYLWVHLTLDIFENTVRVDGDQIVKITSELPKTVDDAYNRILSKSGDPEMALKILHIIVAAARPLTVREMSLAFALKESHRTYNDLDLEPENRFRRVVRHICGLFVTINDSKIYLLHQTAREFLVWNARVNSPQSVPGTLKWKHSLRPQESYGILATICIWHLLLREFESYPLGKDKSPSKYAEDYVFLDYSAKNWAAHLRNSPDEMKKAMTQSILSICDTSSNRFLIWFKIYWTTINTDFPQGFTSLMAASYFGNSFEVVVNRLIERIGSGLERVKQRFRGTDRVNSADKYGRTPLTYAVWSGNVAVVKLLIKAGAKVDLKDEIWGTPLSYAICSGHKEVAELLFRKKTQVDSVDDIIKKLLLSAASEGDEAVVELLLGTDRVDVEVKDRSGQTPLSHAAENGHTAVVNMLLTKVGINARDGSGATALHWAAMGGHVGLISVLLKNGADVEAGDRGGGTPLAWAIQGGSEMSLRMLLAETSNINYVYYLVLVAVIDSK